MSVDPASQDHSASYGSADDQIEALLFECLEAKQPGDAIEAAAQANPEIAEPLRRAYREMLRFDLVGAAPASGSALLGLPTGSVPERLGEYRLLERLGAGGRQ